MLHQLCYPVSLPHTEGLILYLVDHRRRQRWNDEEVDHRRVDFQLYIAKIFGWDDVIIERWEELDLTHGSLEFGLTTEIFNLENQLSCFADIRRFPQQRECPNF